MAELVNVTVRTRHLPVITWGWTPGAPSAPATSGGGGDWLLRWLRPAVEVRTPFGVERRAPWGEPNGSTWPVLLAVPLALVAVVALLIRARRRRSQG